MAIRVLHLEDDKLDMELIATLLHNAGLDCAIECVDTRAAFEECLEKQDWDVILADFKLPAFDGLTALAIARNLRRNTPFLFVTGTMGEENAIDSLKRGATDYVLKTNLVRLAPAVRRALKEREERVRQTQTEAQLQQTQEQLHYLAYHDALTGLPNRALLLERLPDLLAEARRYGDKAAVLFIDLDEFKVINDSLGHSAGDQVLRAVGERLRSTVRQGDMSARLGGDEFVIVLNKMKQSSDAVLAADRVNQLVAYEIASEGHHPLMTTCSIGISVFPDDGTDAETLIRNADAALYAAKAKSRNSWHFFTSDLNRRALERLKMEHALRHALERQEFFVEYQPQVEIVTGKLMGAEALLRWRHPEMGLVPPSTFIPVAENSGELVAIGQWVLNTACRQAKQWEQTGRSAFAIAVNVSAAQLRHPSFLETVRKALADSGLAPHHLELELTESQLMEHAEKVAPLLQSLKELGVNLTIDDFGIGYCGLSYVRTFQFSKLKMDQSFVRSILFTAREAALTGAVIHLARSLRMQVVAECVETVEQAALLHALGCLEIQGYVYSRPVTAEVFEARFLGPTRAVSPLLSLAATSQEWSTLMTKPN